MEDSALKKRFILMIRKQQGLINSLCRLYYPQKQDQLDASQDVILQLWKSFSSFKGESKESTWVYKVCLHTIFSKLRKESKGLPSESLEGVQVLNLCTEATADDDVQLLKQLIESLQGIDKALVLLYLEGYQQKEIASILEMTVTNVSTRMNRIKAALRTQYKTGKYELR